MKKRPVEEKQFLKRINEIRIDIDSTLVLREHIKLLEDKVERIEKWIELQVSKV